MPVRLDDVDGLAAAHPVFAADDVRQVDRLVGQRVQRGGKAGAFGAVRGVVVDRLVGGHGHVGDRVHAVRMSERRLLTDG